MILYSVDKFGRIGTYIATHLNPFVVLSGLLYISAVAHEREMDSHFWLHVQNYMVVCICA